jgi:DNA-binding FadR family transcriptional regulator
VFEPIHQRRAFEEICASIRDRLASGALKPGDKLPAERLLAEQLGVGRNALREALRSLEMAGVVELRTGVKGGAFIREGDPAGLTQVVEDLLYLGTFSMDALTEARVLLMDTVVRLAAERATPAQIAAIRRNAEWTDTLTRDKRYVERVECSVEFYRLLAQATGNPVLEVLVSALTSILMKFIRVRVSAGGAPQPGLAESRRRFAELIAARDVEGAARHMQRHLGAVHKLLGDPVRASRRGASAGAAPATAPANAGASKKTASKDSAPKKTGSKKTGPKKAGSNKSASVPARSRRTVAARRAAKGT